MTRLEDAPPRTDPERPERPAGSVDSERAELRRWVLWTCAALVAVRTVYVFLPLRSDEGGYLFVARHWRAGGEFLYGDYHVDRPPLLLAIFRIAALVEWDQAIRVLSIPFALAFVLAAVRAGVLLAGPAAARWTLLVAAALVASPALAADQADGELFAVPFVMVSILATLEAWRRSGAAARFGWALLAGVLGSAAFLVKQNFLEGFAFAGVLVLASVLRHRAVHRRAVQVTLGTAVGAVLPHLAVLAWATASGIDGLQIWHDVGAMRGQAVEVIWAQSTNAPMTRAVMLLALAVGSGVLPLLVTYLLASPQRALRVRDETWAVNACLAFGVFAIAAGGSYWPHYLLQLAPGLALATALAVGVGAPSTAARMRRWVQLSVAMSLLAGLVVTTAYLVIPRTWFPQRTGAWLAASSAPGDTVFVAYGSPSLLEASGLDTPYPYLWSLPMRTEDPGQQRLRQRPRRSAGADLDRGGQRLQLLEDRRRGAAAGAGPGAVRRRGHRLRQPGVAPLRPPARPGATAGLLRFTHPGRGVDPRVAS